MVRVLSVLALFAAITTSLPALSFPELVRAGYANCITCHYAPTGGGILTQYGRALSGDLMSTFTSENEEKFLFNAFPLPEPLALGGDFRALGLFQSRPSLQQQQQLIFMQNDLEAALSIGKFVIDATGGLDYAGNPISRRHWINYRPTEHLSFRAGRFLPAAGINTENHSIALRRGVGRDQATETYNVEAAYIAENFDVFATGIFGRPDNLSLGAETGAALSASVFFLPGYKIGASYYYGSRDTASRHLAGPWLILGFTHRFFLMVDTAFQWLLPVSYRARVGFADYARLDYELIQGFHVYVTQELNRMDFSDPGAYVDAYGAGVQWFPRPHFEINAVYQLQRFGGGSGSFANYAFVMLHFYP